MSKLIVDSVIELNSDKFALLPTRRQIDWNGGYVNNWITETFYNYVRNQSNIILQRDHSGALQGDIADDGILSQIYDARYFDIIHIDPWKKASSFTSGVINTIDSLNRLYSANSNVMYEIGTEQAIRTFTQSDLGKLLNSVKLGVDEEVFNQIEYVVIQSGVALDLSNRKNVGIYDEAHLIQMIDAVKSYGKKCKEHNGDYLSNDELARRFELGVDSVNIGPEIAQIQTLTYLAHMTDSQIDTFYSICLNSQKWSKWIGNTADVDLTNKKKLIQICGHYCFDKYPNLPKIDDEIKESIKQKLLSLP